MTGDTVSFGPPQVLRGGVRIVQHAPRVLLDFVSKSWLQISQHRQCFPPNRPPITRRDFLVRKHPFQSLRHPRISLAVLQPLPDAAQGKDCPESDSHIRLVKNTPAIRQPPRARAEAGTCRGEPGPRLLRPAGSQAKSNQALSPPRACAHDSGRKVHQQAAGTAARSPTCSIVRAVSQSSILSVCIKNKSTRVWTEPLCSASDSTLAATPRLAGC